MLGQFASSPLGVLQQAASAFSAALGPVGQPLTATTPAPSQLAAPGIPGLPLAPSLPTTPGLTAPGLTAPGLTAPGLTTPVPGQSAIPGAINGLLGSIPMPGTATAPAPTTALAAPNPLQSLMNPFTALP